ncbi:hypothetical protein DENIS_0529 [Desulfonema ishimotonii]|uniref:RNA polymerase sigma factor n=1 Tax=Desulfonema ishimotonii TaxID=45657 RepID=A0A401FRL0_9BACT|nr:sigma-70 family RNA polymerase sigma factor [Desulfonema ishimotonii]GBC59590.1 hypothetical protein DENIS_0529 [Desulfonema ishimotonii]
MEKKVSGSDVRPDTPEFWVDHYGDTLYRFALSRIRKPEVAEDLVQETFMAALRSHRKFRGRSSVRTWLIAILKHKIVDHYRRQSRAAATDDMDYAADHFDALFDPGGHWSFIPAKWSVNPAKVQEQKEFLDIFYQCLSKLPRRMARAFMLREVEGESTEAICKALDISATNSWVILYRARMNLRRCLETHWLKIGI